MSLPTFVLPADSGKNRMGLRASELGWMGQPLNERLREEFARAGLSEGESADQITCTPFTAISAEAITALIVHSNESVGDVRATLGGAASRWCSEAAFGPPAALFRFRGGGPISASRRASAEPIVLSVAVKVFEVNAADSGGGRQLSVALSDAVLCSVHTHCGVLWANLLCLGPTLWRALLGAHPLVNALTLAYGVVRACSLKPERVGAVLSRVDRGASVHPSAVVEGSWIQAGARVGPGAVVRGSVVGPRAIVEALAIVDFCVMGERSCVQRGGIARFSVLHARSSHAGTMQLSVLGPGASVKVGGALMDQNLDQSVRVITDEGPALAPFGLMGVGVGANSFVGSGVWIAPGRLLPEGVSVVPSPRLVLSRMPAANTGLVFVEEIE